jgi:hypothetical protein
MCSAEHRYVKGATGGEEIEEIQQRGFTDEWMPCQADLPGNFWRVVIAGGKTGKGSGRRPRSGSSR